MNADQIRKELRGLAQVRAGLEADLQRNRKSIVATLRKAQETDGITLSEAADELGISRQMAYKLMRGS